MIAANSTPYGFAPWCLAELCEVITDGTHKTPKYTETGIPFISTANIEPFHSFKFDSYKKFISETEHAELTRRCKPEFGDILVSKIGTLGLTKFVDVDYEFSIFVGVALLKLRKAVIDGRFLEQLLNTETYKQAMAAASPGSTRSTLTLTAIKNLQVSIPSLETQRRIAEILSTVDRAIEQTEALIAKQQRIKTGLMQDLLTRGIDEHGNLRSEQTHEFKDSPLGRIPVEWDVVKLLNYIAFIRSGLSRRILEDDIGVPVITSTNIQRSLLDTTQLSFWYLKDPQGAKTESFFLDDGDILLNFINSVEQIGKVCLFQDLGRSTIYTTNLFRIKASQVASQDFLFHLLDSQVVLNEIKLITKPAVNQASFTTGDFLGISVPFIPYDEQLRIVEFLFALNNHNNGAMLSLSKLKHEKNALIQERIDAAFKRPTRLSNNIAEYENACYNNITDIY